MKDWHLSPIITYPNVMYSAWFLKGVLTIQYKVVLIQNRTGYYQFKAVVHWKLSDNSAWFLAIKLKLKWLITACYIIVVLQGR